MDTRKEVSKEAVRAALQALGEGGKEISYRLYMRRWGWKATRNRPLCAAVFPT